MSNPSTDSAAIKAICKSIIQHGWTPTEVNDGEDVVPTTTVAEIVAAVTAVGEAGAYFTKDGKESGVSFVLGNEPFEVACDYHTSLSEAVEAVTDKWDM